ncbi:beta-lactamase family protein [Qipengyuania marisflavi]|uniref:Beta-lactamase family protein n=2 Tax=Qipengyuania marisflavi TaxID=2486356 RepID=A0A5S3P379_9SPHN|nr:beta-lactamase family protein [Qipengyuania marisflavi]
MLSACAPTLGGVSPPAGVAVGFNRQQITPLVVEGAADRTTGRIVTADDPVRIASISKLIVALGVMRMVEAGQLDLDRDVSDYLGWTLRNPHAPQQPLTLRLLLSHRAGLRDAADYVIPLGDSVRARLSRKTAWVPPAPGGVYPFEYGNINFPVIASVMETVSGERFDRLMTRQVFAPLGIDACLNWSGCSDAAVARAVVLYRSTGEVARDDMGGARPGCIVVAADDGSCDLTDYALGTNGSLFSPQGGVRISANGLARIGQMLLRGGDDFLTAASIAELARPVGEDTSGLPFFCRYGLAVQTLGGGGAGCDDALFADGRSRIGHAGEAYGLRSGLWLDMERGTGMAYFLTGVPDRTSVEEGGFADEERAFVARAEAAIGAQRK